MKSSVITNENASTHFVENYRFKVLGNDGRGNEYSEEMLMVSDEPAVEYATPQSQVAQTQESDPIQPAQSQFQQPQQSLNQPQAGFDVNFVEELLKKTDELSGNIIKLQMQIENQESEFAKRLESEILRAKEDGRNEGLAQASTSYEAKIAELEARFTSSIAKLDDEYDKFEEFLKKSETELADAATLIAKEIVAKEISSNSALIATNISSSLVRDLSDAKNIQIRVHPDDAQYLKSHFSAKENIKIIPDDAISKGGVVIISEVGNIDATIETRIEKLKMLVGE
ncbi:flagellar assembly protein FliH [Campylobacter sp. RM13119]|uniref:flagellar assembly protein FliH n=1 Tax=Campylobacter californiensis TaxID=1032243 RepID=UPI001475EBF8|nr:flagellar assembly protein FliH [Campylobacter sp. RM13119]MBE3605941.1 flagellar assembly protein FliH [Campylobacter sp. RM13119]